MQTQIQPVGDLRFIQAFGASSTEMSSPRCDCGCGALSVFFFADDEKTGFALGMKCATEYADISQFQIAKKKAEDLAVGGSFRMPVPDWLKGSHKAYAVDMLTTIRHLGLTRKVWISALSEREIEVKV